MNRVDHSLPVSSKAANPADVREPAPAAPRPLTTASPKRSSEIEHRAADEIVARGHVASDAGHQPRIDSIETEFLKALIPAQQASDFLKSQSVIDGIEDLKHDWSALIGDREDPLLQIARLTLENHQLNARDLHHAIHTLIES